MEADNCGICFQPIDSSDDSSFKQCLHCKTKFHTECFQELTNKLSCPYCTNFFEIISTQLLKYYLHIQTKLEVFYK